MENKSVEDILEDLSYIFATPKAQELNLSFFNSFEYI